MKVGDEYRFDAISKADLIVAARKLALTEEWAAHRIDEIRNGVAEAFASAAALVQSPFRTSGRRRSCGHRREARLGSSSTNPRGGKERQKQTYA